MKEKTCVMFAGERPDLTDVWYCESCKADFPYTSGFINNTHCPNCKAKIFKFEDFDTDEEMEIFL